MKLIYVIAFALPLLLPVGFEGCNSSKADAYGDGGRMVREGMKAWESVSPEDREAGERGLAALLYAEHCDIEALPPSMRKYAPQNPPVLPPADTGVALFYDGEKMADQTPQGIRMHFREMVQSGCTTLTLYAVTVKQAAMTMDIAIEEGLVDRFPVLFLNNVRGGADWEKSGSLSRFSGEAKAASKYPAQWPELIHYGWDEIDGGKQEGVQNMADKLHDEGLRLAQTSWVTRDYIGIADILIPIVYSCTEKLRTDIRAGGSDFWAYSIGPFHYGSNYHLARFMAGVWRWKVRPDVFLGWSYMDSQGSAVMHGLRDGCLDYRVLRALETALDEKDSVVSGPPQRSDDSLFFPPLAREWLEKLRADIPWDPYAGMPAHPPVMVRPQLHLEVGIPAMANFDHYRQWAGYWLSEITGCDQIW